MKKISLAISFASALLATNLQAQTIYAENNKNDSTVVKKIEFTDGTQGCDIERHNKIRMRERIGGRNFTFGDLNTIGIRGTQNGSGWLMIGAHNHQFSNSNGYAEVGRSRGAKALLGMKTKVELNFFRSYSKTLPKNVKGLSSRSMKTIEEWLDLIDSDNGLKMSIYQGAQIHDVVYSRNVFSRKAVHAYKHCMNEIAR
ncbi:hypothetical protein HOP38_16130 [Vibrio mediterranei]|uniref:hypothetical protein n=1 Tax=Vibrio mediterranei TaxID=689 RepID=UPI0017FC1D70|nr:hypothetical protein [Vibrio mediterranei]NUW74020.1 hypothetical protein [Vibrio mediterranei]